MVPNRFSRMLWSLRVTFGELHDYVSSWLAARRYPRVVVPGPALCEIFAYFLRTNGFEDEAEAVEKPGTSDEWEDHSRAFVKSLVESGDKEAMKRGAELITDTLGHVMGGMTATSIAMVMLDIGELWSRAGELGRAVAAAEVANSFDRRNAKRRNDFERRILVYWLCEATGDEPSYSMN